LYRNACRGIPDSGSGRNRNERNQTLKAIKELYQYREMLKNLVRKDLRTRYKGSFLGFLWTFINPLLQLLVYTVIFTTIMRLDIDNYSMFLFVALLPWNFFSTSLMIGTGSIVNNKELIKKIYFPREIVPISVVTSGFVNLILSFVIVFIALFVSGIGITPAVVCLPVVFLVAYVMTLGFTLLFSALNVYFRDLEHILEIGTMAWFYLTPIVYKLDMIPARFLKLFFMNPMTPIIQAFRDILYYGIVPDFTVLGINLAAGMLLVVFGHLVFQRLQKNFAEEI
jgi:ABC-2 type transport system permease protein